MEEKKSPVEVLLERGETYAKTTLQLFKLKATDQVARIVSNIASGFVILILLILLFINLNIGIALVIGDLLGKIRLGFMIMAGFYGLMGLFVYLFRDRWIKNPVSNVVIAQLLKEEQTDDDQQADS
jgi:Zn-dependent protease with chaperone function